MTEVGDYAGIVGLLMSLAAIAPKLLAIITRRRQIDVQGEINRFEVIMKAQDDQLKQAEVENKECKDELRTERNERIHERDYFHRQITHLSAKIYEFEGILRRLGWKDERKTRRTRVSGEQRA